MIEVRSDGSARLTTFVCTGTITPGEIENEIREFYQASPTLNTAWDFSGSELSKLTAAGIEGIARLVRNAAHSREGGRTALIFPIDQLMTMGDRFDSIGQIEVAHAKIKIFDSWDKARSWLSQ